jgi:hypothetical protein
LLLLLFICSHVHTLFGSFLHPFPPPQPFLPSPTQFLADHVLPLWLILLKKRHKHNKKESVFASWLKDSYTERFLLLLSCTHVLWPMLIQR